MSKALEIVGLWIHAWYSIIASRISSTRPPSCPEFLVFLKNPSTLPCFSSGSRSLRVWCNFLPIHVGQTLRFILAGHRLTAPACFSFLAPRCHPQEWACRAARRAHRSGVLTIRWLAYLPLYAVGPMSLESSTWWGELHLAVFQDKTETPRDRFEGSESICRVSHSAEE